MVWQNGCAAAQVRLATSDFRRTTDKDFWWGWNGLTTAMCDLADRTETGNRSISIAGDLR